MADRAYPFYLVRTAFHGGGVISRHWSEGGAERARKRVREQTECTCGCALVVPADDYNRLPTPDTAQNPYAAARR